MLESVVSAIAGALGQSGLAAAGAYPKRALCAFGDGVVCVGVKSAKGVPAGFGGYLGLGRDPATGLSGELYGARCRLEIAIDIYVPATAENGPEECLRRAGLAARALGALPEGLKVSSLSFGQPGPDEETGMFLCPGVLSATAHFIAKEKDGDGEFTDFVLRGSVKG